MDENLEKEAVSPEGTSEETTPVESPTTNEPIEEVEEISEEDASEAETTEAEAIETKKGAQNRIRNLVKERDEYRDQVQSLSDRLAEISRSDDPVGYIPNIPQYQNEPVVSPGEELSAEELNRRIQAREQRIVQTVSAQNVLMQKQQEAVQRINNEAQQVMKLHPELDPDNDNFDRDLSETITEAVEAHVRANPYSASVSKFVNKLMKPYKASVSKEAGKATEKIAEQASQAALRPSSISRKEKTAGEMTLAELEAKLGVVQA